MRLVRLRRVISQEVGLLRHADRHVPPGRHLPRSNQISLGLARPDPFEDQQQLRRRRVSWARDGASPLAPELG
eukprot:15019315-Alexandrium_andersonii.AAC.1